MSFVFRTWLKNIHISDEVNQPLDHKQEDVQLAIQSDQLLVCRDENTELTESNRDQELNRYGTC